MGRHLDFFPCLFPCLVRPAFPQPCRLRRERDAALGRSVISRPEPEAGKRRLGVWLALLALAFQVGFSTAHSAWHFDHLVGPLGGSDHRTAAGDSPSGQPSPGAPASPDFDHCAIGLGLLAAGSGIIAGAMPLPVPTRVEPVSPSAAASAAAIIARPHFRPPPRAPPVIGMSA